MNKKIITNQKGVLSNRGYKIVTNVLWIVAIISMVGLGVAIYQLKVLTKEIRTELSK